jgi:hypothetical protein
MNVHAWGMATMYEGDVCDSLPYAGQANGSNGHDIRHGCYSDSRTTGWRPSCSCGSELIPVPCTVMDCFGGSGTTGEVAIGMGRRAVLCELNPAYVKIANERLMNRMPLFSTGAA